MHDWLADLGECAWILDLGSAGGSFSSEQTTGHIVRIDEDLAAFIRRTKRDQIVPRHRHRRAAPSGRRHNRPGRLQPRARTHQRRRGSTRRDRTRPETRGPTLCLSSEWQRILRQPIPLAVRWWRAHQSVSPRGCRTARGIAAGPPPRKEPGLVFVFRLPASGSGTAEQSRLPGGPSQESCPLPARALHAVQWLIYGASRLADRVLGT